MSTPGGFWAMVVTGLLAVLLGWGIANLVLHDDISDRLNALEAQATEAQP